MPILTTAEIDEELARRSLEDFIPWVTPAYETPRHLGPLMEVFERIAAGEELRIALSAPPRHAKTETVIHGMAWLLMRRPELVGGYVSYAADLSEEKSRKCLDLCVKLGLAHERQSSGAWRTSAGGGLYATGLMGPLTGRGVDLLLVDDPIKNRVEAESKVFRDRAWDWISDVGETRVEPGGSVIVFMTRWHPDDIIGRMQKEWGSKFIRIPAIDEDGRALWPERWPVEKLLEKKARNAFTFESLYQGRPRRKGERVFGDVHHYDALPDKFYRVAIGVDLAYTEKKSADWSVAIVGRGVGQGDETALYIESIRREQVLSATFKPILRGLHEANPTAPMESYVHGTEKGAVSLFDSGDDAVPLRGITAHGDKRLRAEPVATAWNAGRVLLPKDAPWLEDFIEEVTGFTGVKDAHDDQVDALASCFDALSGGTYEVDEEPPPAQRTGLAAMGV